MTIHVDDTPRRPLVERLMRVYASTITPPAPVRTTPTLVRPSNVIVTPRFVWAAYGGGGVGA